MSGIEEPTAGIDWKAYRAARNRFLARVRPESMDDPPPLVCPEAPPEEWPPVAAEADADTGTADG